MGRLGAPELLVILFIVFLLFGAKKLPELARSLGQSINEFNKAKDEIHRPTTEQVVDVKKTDEVKAKT